MKQTTAPSRTPSPNREKTKLHTSKDTKSPSAVFVTMALDMSWRLAVVVLVPTIGGFELDKRLHTTPLLTIIGFVLAMLGMAFVLWQTLQTVNGMPAPKKEKHS